MLIHRNVGRLVVVISILVFVHIFWRISLFLIILKLIYVLTRLVLILNIITIHVKVHICILCVHGALLHLCLFYTFLYQIESMVALGNPTFAHLLRRVLLWITFLRFQLFLICLNSFNVAGNSFLVTFGANLSATLGCKWCIGLFCLIGATLAIQLKTHLRVILANHAAFMMVYQSFLHWVVVKWGLRIDISKLVLSSSLCFSYLLLCWKLSLSQLCHDLAGLVSIMSAYQMQVLVKHAFLSLMSLRHMSSSNGVTVNCFLLIWHRSDRGSPCYADTGIMFHVIVLSFGKLHSFVTDDIAWIGICTEEVKSNRQYCQGPI